MGTAAWVSGPPASAARVELGTQMLFHRVQKQDLMWMPLISWTEQRLEEVLWLMVRKVPAGCQDQILIGFTTIVKASGCHGGSACVGEKLCWMGPDWTWCCFTYLVCSFHVYLFFPSAIELDCILATHQILSQVLCFQDVPENSYSHTTVQLIAFRIRSFYSGLKDESYKKFQRANTISKRHSALVCFTLKPEWSWFQVIKYKSYLASRRVVWTSRHFGGQIGLTITSNCWKTCKTSVPRLRKKLNKGVWEARIRRWTKCCPLSLSARWGRVWEN